MGEELQKQTDGRLSIEIYPSMQLGGEKEMIEQAQVGALAMARISVGPMGPSCPSSTSSICPSCSATPRTWRR
jgi:TRAP-type C4-dicarboxylate transport system substrate-binding protein